MRLVAYLRVSTEVQARDGLGLGVQRDAVAAWAERNGHHVVSWHEDVKSGRNGVDDRPGLAGAVLAIRSGEADGLVTYNLDRLARTLHVQEAILGQVWAKRTKGKAELPGGSVFTVENGEVPEDDPDDPYRRAMRQMRGVFSELERAVIRSRMEAGRRAAVAAGRRGQGAPPYGYQAEHGRLVPDGDEQAVLARIRQLRDEGHSLRAIAATLNDEGTPARRGRWHADTVRLAIGRAEGGAATGAADGG